MFIGQRFDSFAIGVILDRYLSDGGSIDVRSMFDRFSIDRFSIDIQRMLVGRKSIDVRSILDRCSIYVR